MMVSGHKLKDAFTCNPSVVFAKRTVKDLKLPPAFVTHIASSIQSQLADFRSCEGRDMYAGEKIVPIKDMNNFGSDPEEFAKTFCKDLDCNSKCSFSKGKPNQQEGTPNRSHTNQGDHP
ncbi:chromatin structure-remodeling complex protein BSH-like isoform X2 [Humulus lupulus]|uniref:chromatin structure-remodeling complex protein BSH-like isoform X2 n=1 Tax=Humulus lupulus TaxID=3486 RepID=UPI002B40AA1E|nr:chromatin structure-remodeling complex protein BSH-like isoform X2 [Humulus lupulus]